MAKSAREVALDGLKSRRRQGAWSDLFLKKAIKDAGLDDRDAALATRLCYGVLQNISLCDFYIASFSKVSIKKIEPQVLDILRLGIYQLTLTDRIPASAAVNECVKMARKQANTRAVGFVNALLRAASSCEKLPEIPKDDFSSYLSVRYSHPLWLVNRFIARLGEEQTEKLLAMNNEPAPLSVQVNTLVSSTAAVLKSLEDKGLTVTRHPLSSTELLLENAGSIEELDIFAQGCIMVQDTAAFLSVAAAEPQPGMDVLDMCAAPGGKSFAAAILMNNTGTIIANDIYSHKIGLIEEGAQRLGITIVYAKAADAAVYYESFSRRFDLVIADVPCSGMGIIRKKPDIRFKAESSLKDLPEIQYSILENAARYVKPGGILLYSTCTLFEEENEGVVARFLQGSGDFYLEEFAMSGLGIIKGQITLWPQQYDTDGFYFARLRRRHVAD